MVVRGAGATHILEQFENGMLCDTRHTDNCVYARPFHKGGDHLNAFAGAESVREC